MKKTILIFTATILGIVACNEREVGTTNPQIDEEIQTAPPVYDDDLKNFCKGCGKSNIAADGCHDDECREDYICEMTEAQIIAEEAGVPFDLNFNDAYEIRDNFLIKTPKGQDYISHFYEFGGFLIDNSLIDLSNIVDFIGFGHEVYKTVDVLRTGDPNSIVLDSELKSRCLLYVNLIREHNQHDFIENRLKMVEEDLDLFENKGKDYILSHL
jgi:hypothetical protein